jgi:hypothetical protein
MSGLPHQDGVYSLSVVTCARAEAGRQQFSELERCGEGYFRPTRGHILGVSPLSVLRSNAREGFRQTRRSGEHRKALQVWRPEGLNRRSSAFSRAGALQLSLQCLRRRYLCSEPSGIMAPCRLAPSKLAPRGLHCLTTLQ